MINYFMKKYAMSQTGANNLRKAVFSRTILNLTKMFPPMIAFMFIFQSLSDMDTAEEAIPGLLRTARCMTGFLRI